MVYSGLMSGENEGFIVVCMVTIVVNHQVNHMVTEWLVVLNHNMDNKGLQWLMVTIVV